jgi:predicted dienelactone hydrolase
MRPLEDFLVIEIAVAAVCLLMGRGSRSVRLFMAATLLFTDILAVVEGAHWQMALVYLAAGVLFLAAWKSAGDQSRSQRFVICATLLFASMSVLFSFLLPMFTLPEPTGNYPVGTAILYFKDSTRIEDAGPASGSARELMVQIWYPSQPSHRRFARYREELETNALSSYQSEILTHSRLDAPMALKGAPFPVILFNHSWGGRRTNYTFLTEELASHGYAVVSIDHTYNANLVAFPDGRVIHGNASNAINDPETSTVAQVWAIWDKELAKSVADQRFILDRLEAMNRASGSLWFGGLDTRMTGAIGHSFGGAAATAVCAEDRRVHAAVNMDGWFFGAIRDRGPNQPLLAMDAYNEQPGDEYDPNDKIGAALETTDFAELKASLQNFGGYMLSVKGASHEDFTDQPLISPLRYLSHRGMLPAREIHNIVRSYVVAFFDKTLRGEDPEILGAYASPYAEVLLEEWPPGKKGTVSSTGSGGQ